MTTHLLACYPPQKVLMVASPQLFECQAKDCPDLENGQPHTDRFHYTGCIKWVFQRAISRTLTSLLVPVAFRIFREEKKEVLERPSGAHFDIDN
jgi:hypothetical protein